MEQCTIADLIELFAFPVGVAIWLIWVFIDSRGGNCASHGPYRTKECRECKEERLRNAEYYDRTLERLRREGRLHL